MPAKKNRVGAFQKKLVQMLAPRGVAADLCRVTGIKPPTLSGYRSGKNVPNLNDTMAIAEHFGMSLDELTADPETTNSGECELRELVPGTKPGTWSTGRKRATIHGDIRETLRASKSANLLMYRMSNNQLDPLILPGEWLIIDTEIRTVRWTKEPFLVFVNGELTCRYLFQDDSGRTVAVAARSDGPTEIPRCVKRSKIEVVGLILAGAKWLDGVSINRLENGFRMIRTERT